MIPYDNALIGKLPSDDIWNLSFRFLEKLNFNLVNFNEIFFEDLGILENDLKSICKMKVLNFYDKYLKENKHLYISYSSWIYCILKSIEHKETTNVEFFIRNNYFENIEKIKILDWDIRIKDILDFILANDKIETNIKLTDLDNEVWTEGPAVLISEKHLIDIKF